MFFCQKDFFCIILLIRSLVDHLLILLPDLVVQNLILFKMNFMCVYFVRAILSHFYKDEVEYTETVNRLFEVIKYTAHFP